ncbi:MAG: glutaredoxin family protein [Burkholderiales bacterium]
MRAILAVLIAAATATANAGGLYKWADPSTGETVYSNEPPPAAIKAVEQKKIVTSSIQTSDLPYGVQQAVKRSPITLYVTNCGEYCDSARAYLAKRGLPHTEKNPQQSGDAEQFRKVSNGGMEVPLLRVGTQTVRGFDEAQYDAALQSAGYPKTPLTALGLKPAQPKQASPAPLFEKPGGAISDERVAPLGATPDAGAARALLP